LELFCFFKKLNIIAQFSYIFFCFYYWLSVSPNVIVSGLGLSIFGLGHVLNGKSSGI